MPETRSRRWRPRARRLPNRPRPAFWWSTKNCRRRAASLRRWPPALLASTRDRTEPGKSACRGNPSPERTSAPTSGRAEGMCSGESPVRVAQSVSESMHTTRRHSVTCRIKTGVKRDGTLVAKACAIHLDTGAYADNGPQVANRAAQRVIGPYRIPHLQIDAYAVYTNSVPAGSFRSIGAPQSIWACESQMDIIAERLGIDPLALRLKNRSEEHTSELQSLAYLVCRLLLEKKKNKIE